MHYGSELKLWLQPLISCHITLLYIHSHTQYILRVVVIVSVAYSLCFFGRPAIQTALTRLAVASGGRGRWGAPSSLPCHLHLLYLQTKARVSDHHVHGFRLQYHIIIIIIIIIIISVHKYTHNVV